jgi:hypothetical protein
MSQSIHRVPGLLIVIAAALIAGLPTDPGTAQSPTAEAGICGGTICGPSGAFTAPSFPTLTPIDWDAFPTNPARPYRPQDGGRVIAVATSGSDQNDGSPGAPLATLRHAVESARSGDVILVADGTYAIGGPDYYEGLILETPGIILAAENIGGVTLTPADPYTKIGIAARADDLTIDGFVLRGFSSVGIEFGRTSSPQRGLVLKHLEVAQVEEGIRVVYGGSGAPTIDGLLVYDVWLHEVSGIGMQCGEGPCLNLRWEALRVEMPAAGDSGNSGLDALAVEAGDNVVVFNADVSGAAADGIDLKSERAAVANVIVHNIGRNGIKLWRGGDVINALVFDTDADAAVVFETGNAYRVLNTLVARHSWGDSAYAMSVAYDHPTEPGQLQIINSVFYQNSGAIWISPAVQVEVRNSIFFGSGNMQELIWGDIAVGEADSPISALEQAGAGADNLGFVDPQFADPDAGDFTWGAGSPLLDAGTEAGGILPDFDLYGNPRVAGAAVDLGPWEVR